MKRIIMRRIILGFIIGALVGNFIALLSSGFTTFVSPQTSELFGNIFGIVLQSILSGLIGMAGIGGMSFYDTDLMDSKGLLFVTFSHYICVIFAFILASVVLGWGNLIGIVIMVLIESMVFFAIWLIMCYKWKQEIKKMNENLERYKEENLDEKNNQ